MGSGVLAGARRGAALAIAAGALGIGAAPAAAAPPTACAKPGYVCSTVDVPLDRTGAVPGTIALSVVRKPLGAAPTASAVVALAGGPGQSATPIAEAFAEDLAPALATRDLLVFDQRGTGQSGVLRCPSLSSTTLSLVSAVGRCASTLGATRGFYRTADTVADLEALRVQLGYDKLVLYGVSYGTRVAFDYASAYPSHVEALVLDSVTPQAGIDAFSRPTIQAIPKMLADLCAKKACPFTASARSDLTTLARKLSDHTLKASLYSSSGRRVTRSFTQDNLLTLLVSTDLSPRARSAIPAAIHAALRDDFVPLMRLGSLFTSSVASQRPSQSDDADEYLSQALYLATTCEEQPLGWARTTLGASARIDELDKAARALEPAEVAPFRRDVATLSSGVAQFCLGWPIASPPPVAPGPLPPVPTLVIEGGGDLRTPPDQARAAIAGIPGAQMVVVPRVGHSVLGSDETKCANDAVAAFFAAQPVAPCTHASAARAPDSPPPSSFARVRPVSGYGGKVGRTLTVLRETISDAIMAGGGDVGGIRGGAMRFNRQGTALDLTNDSWVRGVKITGSIPASLTGTRTFRISGPSAARGTVRVGLATGRVDGTLGGKRVAMGFFASSAAVRGARGAAAPAPQRTSPWGQATIGSAR